MKGQGPQQERVERGISWKDRVAGRGSWRGGLNHSIPHEQKIVYFRKKNLVDVWYNASEEELAVYNKMYVAKVKNAGGNHLVQEWFSRQGVFSIKATPMGANLVLLEEMEEGFIQAILDESEEWFYEVFDDLRKWCQMDYDKERVVWVRCHGIPVLAWNNEFFSAIATRCGTFLGVDENTRKKNTLDVARILIRTKCYDVFNMVVDANINGIRYEVKVLEEWCGPLSWGGLTSPNDDQISGGSANSDCSSDDDDGLPLCGEDGEAENQSEEEGEEAEAGRTVLQEGINVIVDEVST